MVISRGIPEEAEEMMGLRSADLAIDRAIEDTKMARQDLLAGAARFGVAVRVARASLGLSSRKLAKAAGCSHVYLGDVERGKEIPSPEMRINIIRALRGDE